MDTTCTWKNKLLFTAVFGPHDVTMDAKAPFGTDQAATPKELVLAAICGCTGMDVVSLLRKAKQNADAFSISAHAEMTEGHPAVFKRVHLVYRVDGVVDQKVILDAVTKSMTLYCGVSAMMAKACPISYEVQHNSEKIGAGDARFS